MLIALLIFALIILVIVVFKYPMISLGLFLTISFVKGALMLKFSFFRVVDVTVLCAILVLIAMTYSFVRSGGRMKDILSLPAFLFLLLAAVLLLGITYTSAPNYGFMKSTRFATLTLIAFLAPVFFAHRLQDIKLMIWILLVVGIILAVGTVVAPYAAVIRTLTRARFLEAGPLATAGKIGTASVIAFIFTIMAHTSKRLRIISLAAIPLMIIGIIITQSRGPFIGLFITWLMAMFICRRGVSKAWQSVIVGTLVIAIIASFVMLPEIVTSRITRLWKSGYYVKETVRSRTEMFAWAARRFPERPILGHGTGAFAVDRGGQDRREYPHNVILELLYEQGLVGAIIISLFLWLIFRRWRQASRIVHLYELDIETFQIVHISGLVFLFTFTQAMKSGDINDARFMFFCAGLVVAAFSQVRRRVEEISSENESTADDWQQLEEVGFQDTRLSY